MSERNADLLNRFQLSHNHSDEKEFLSLIQEDAEFVMPKATYRGKSEILKWFHEKSKNDSIEWEDHWHHVRDNHFHRKGLTKHTVSPVHLIQEVWADHGKISKVVVRHAATH
eukprot:TRINITY_DN2270_c0_g1_i1.p1 TRINITY_DN2270_c0_g1~~TRINITY_DN2270_c0_g1_i1.p1  ORF type:complete len:112 (-),score=25.16 TRINITY_DN2270_c0_g1_i1:234-569(-)